MKSLKTLVLMQFRNKIDVTWVRNKKTIIRTIVFSLLKFIIITAIIYAILLALMQLGVFYYSEASIITTLMLTISLILSTISCTVGLMKSLYFADDNKVLITFPVANNYIFISKLIVYFVYEIKRSFGFIIPITLSCVMLLFSHNACSFFVFIWMWIPLLFIIALPVVIGGILSIPTMYVYSFLRQHSILEIIITVLGLGAVITGIVVLINRIPSNIDLVNQWKNISGFLRTFLLDASKQLDVIGQLVYAIIGEKAPSSNGFIITWLTFVKFICIVLVALVSFLVVFFVSKPIFFKMMAKSGEENVNKITRKANTRHNPYISFVNKELKINLRTMEISINYLLIYIVVPILILLLNAVFRAMDTKTLGDLLIYTSNILLICLPMLASNALVATYYSREGHTGYLKKTKPIFAAYPLLAKLIFNIAFSIPSIAVTVWIFGLACNFSPLTIIVFDFAILFLHIAHMLWSAMLDIMNPQNEQYQTNGDSTNNPNETKSTIIAFVISFLYALMSFKLFQESIVTAPYKLLLISTVLLVVISVLLVKRIKAYYYD